MLPARLCLLSIIAGAGVAIAPRVAPLTVKAPVNCCAFGGSGAFIAQGFATFSVDGKSLATNAVFGGSAGGSTLRFIAKDTDDPAAAPYGYVVKATPTGDQVYAWTNGTCTASSSPQTTDLRLCFGPGTAFSNFIGTDNIAGAVLDVWSTPPSLEGGFDVIRTTSALCAVVDYMLLETPLGVVAGFGWGGNTSTPPAAWLQPPAYCP